MLSVAAAIAVSFAAAPSGVPAGKPAFNRISIVSDVPAVVTTRTVAPGGVAVRVPTRVRGPERASESAVPASTMPTVGRTDPDRYEWIYYPPGRNWPRPMTIQEQFARRIR